MNHSWTDIIDSRLGLLTVACKVDLWTGNGLFQDFWDQRKFMDWMDVCELRCSIRLYHGENSTKYIERELSIH